MILVFYWQLDGFAQDFKVLPSRGLGVNILGDTFKLHVGFLLLTVGKA